MIYFAQLPEVSDRYPEGRQLLNKLTEQARLLTEVLKYNKSRGVCEFDFKKLLLLAESENPSISEGIDTEFLSFTGRRVIVNEKKFFTYYETTPEGQRYAKEMKSLSPTLYGHFMYIHV